jgi:hypothetical protein
MRWRGSVQHRNRLFAVLEAMDNGEPIRRTRDINILPVAATARA